MKNKKLVATVASLCLVVVAVVAAVVGVFAAVNQAATATFQITYTAVNAATTITVEGRGPVTKTGGGRELKNTASSNEDDYAGVSTTIAPTSNTTTASLTFPTNFDFGWSDDQGATAASPANSGVFYGHAIYEFKFENNSKINALSIGWAASNVENLTVKYYYSATQLTEQNLSVNPTWGDKGALRDDSLALTSGTAVTGSSLSLPNSLKVSTADATATIYLYVLVGLSDATVARSNSSNFTLSFDLAGIASASGDIGTLVNNA